MTTEIVLALDVDGTLCERGLPPSDRTLEAIQSARERCSVCLCTGRQYIGIRSMVAQMGLTMPQVVSDGAVVVSPLDGSEVHVEELGTALLELVVRTADEFGATLVLGGAGKAAIRAWNDDIDYMLSYGDPEPQIVDNLLHIESFRPTIALLVDRSDSAKLALLESVLSRSGELSVRRSARGYVNIVPAGVSKASGLRRAMEIHGVDSRSATIVAVGDGMNDLPLLRVARVPVAMSNACDSVRAAAQVIAPAVSEGGVAWVVERILSGELLRQF